MIPPELRAIDHWLLWHAEHRDGAPKPTKVPYNARTGRRASATEPGDWSPYAVALAALRANSVYYSEFCVGTDHASPPEGAGNSVYSVYSVYHAGYAVAGIGFVFGPDDPYCGVDLDHAYDNAGHMHDWARDLIASLGSYAELSPSRRGVHIIARATLKPGRRRCGSVEVYDRARYFTMTGEHIAGSPEHIAPTQAAIDDLVDHLGAVRDPAAGLDVWASAPLGGDLRSRAASGRIRRDTLLLLDSTGPAGYASSSEADAALCAGLAGTGLAAPEILQLVEGSLRGYDAYRRKGNRHGLYYWRRTVEHAVRLVGPIVTVDRRRVQAGGRACR